MFGGEGGRDAKDRAPVSFRVPRQETKLSYSDGCFGTLSFWDQVGSLIEP